MVLEYGLRHAEGGHLFKRLVRVLQFKLSFDLVVSFTYVSVKLVKRRLRSSSSMWRKAGNLMSASLVT